MADKFALQTNRAVVNGRLRPAGIIVDGSVISDIVDPSDIPADMPIDDVGDSVVMPGLVDTHVHVNEPGRTNWEGFESATRAACAGGITTIVDMPLNSSPVTTTVEALATKRAAARDKLYVDCGFYGGLIPGNVDDIEGLIDAGVLGAKAFLCHSGIDEFPAATKGQLREAMPILADRNVPLLVHAELADGEVPGIGDPTDYAQYAATRPPRWELNAIELLLELCEQTGCAVHIVHLATAEALPVLQQAREDGLPVTVETCPHYLNFCTDEIPLAAPEYKCAPPIRDGENRNRLREALRCNKIDTVGTDHSPSPPSLKCLDEGNVRNAWGGIASLQLLLPALWTPMSRLGATPVEVSEWTSRRPAELIGAGDRLGAIAPGYRANLVVWNPDKSFVVDADQLHHRHPVTPYDGEPLFGVVEATYLAGQHVFDGNHIAERPQGYQLSNRTKGETK